MRFRMQGQPMMSKDSRHLTFPTLALLFAVVGLLTASTTFAQRLPGTENGEWRYLGGDAGHTRSSSLDQINGNNFDDLEQLNVVVDFQKITQVCLILLHSQ